MNRLFGIRLKHIHSGMRRDALRLWVMSFLSFQRQWRGWDWMDQGGGWDGGEGGLWWQAKSLHHPAHGLGPVPLSELCCQLLDLFCAWLARGDRCSWTCNNVGCLDWKGGLIVCGMWVWHSEGPLICPNGGALMSQRMDERVGVLLCVCVGERAELELRVSEAFLLLQTPMWSTVGCIKGTKMNSFTHPHFFPNLYDLYLSYVENKRWYFEGCFNYFCPYS